jgi:hypothetical protein
MKKGRRKGHRRSHRRSTALTHHRHHAMASTQENPLGGLGEVIVGTGIGALLGVATYAYSQSTSNTNSTNPITLPQNASYGTLALAGGVLGLIIAGCTVAAGKL